MPIWRAQLLADPLAARVELGVAREQLQRHEQALDSAELRLGQAAFGGASFTMVAQREPERALQEIIGAMRTPPPSAGAASYSLREEAPSAWMQAEARFRALVAQARETISAFALVETRLGELLVGRTRVNWGGDTRSVLGASVTQVQASIHRRTLALAIRSRTALLRMLGIVLRGARIVAQAISSPLGAITALPAAWKFVDELLREGRG